MSNWLELLVALCGAEFVHNSFEIWSIRKKLNWLDFIENGKDFGKWPFNINNRYKWVALHSLILIIFTGLFFAVLHMLSFEDSVLIAIGILTVLGSYIFTTCRVNRYHQHIGRLIKSHRKNA